MILKTDFLVLNDAKMRYHILSRPTNPTMQTVHAFFTIFTRPQATSDALIIMLSGRTFSWIESEW